MRHFFKTIILFSIIALQVHAQDNEEEHTEADSTKKRKSELTLNIGSDESRDTSDRIFSLGGIMLDLGANYLNDQTDYNSAAAQNFLRVDPRFKNENLFSLRQNKLMYVNLGVFLKVRLLKTRVQRIYAGIGLGAQFYNYFFNKPVTYVNDTSPGVVMDSIYFRKNKISVNYLTIPLQLTFKTRLDKNLWLVYGLGLSGGLRTGSWTKQISDERGKQKNHDEFNLKRFNAAVSAELGLDGYFRLFASYQLTPLHDYALEQYPYAVGIRFSGI